MPNGKKYKKKYDLPKRRSYRSRFSDKKINTAIEKKMKAIAEREVNKKIVYYLHATPIHGGAVGSWSSSHGAPSSLSSMEALTTDINYHYLTNFTEEVINSNIDNPASNVDVERARMSTDIRVKTIQANIRFINTSQFTRTVRVALIYVPNLNQATLTGGAPVSPQVQWLGDTNGKYRGIFRNMLKDAYGNPVDATKTKPGTSFTVVAQKVIKLRSTRNTGFAGTDQDKSLDYREVFLSKTYKNGKKLLYNRGQLIGGARGYLQNSGNFLVAYIADTPNGADTEIYCYGVGGVKFRMASPQADITGKLV